MFFLPYPQFQHVSEWMIFCQSTNCSGRYQKLTPKQTWLFMPNVSASLKKFRFDFMQMYCMQVLSALSENMPFSFFLLGIGLCLCFKLKRLKTSELWTSVWPTWVQVGSLIIAFSPTLWRTFTVFWCQPVPCVLMCLAGNERSGRKKSCVLQ